MQFPKQFLLRKKVPKRIKAYYQKIFSKKNCLTVTIKEAFLELIIYTNQPLRINISILFLFQRI